MKKLPGFVTMLFIAFSLTAQPPKGPADKGMTFGAKVDADGAVSADDVPVLLSDKTSAEIKVKGKVIEVCKAEGCWLKMQTANGPMMIKMKDHSFMVPLSLDGKTIVAAGTANNKETSVEMLRHYAEDAGKSKEEIEAIKTPKKEITMQATGILVL